MNVDPYTRKIIQEQGIWTRTKCLAKENHTLDRIIEVVEQQGFRPSAQNRRWWQRNHNRVVIALVDDVIAASEDYDTDMPYLFDRNTLVITDNYIGCPTLYQVLPMPASFFSIYHLEQVEQWQPDRSFCFSVNRLDDRRFRLMLELALRAHLPQGYVNFNCQQDYFPTPHLPSEDELQSNFREHYGHMAAEDQTKYRASFDLLANVMPYRNYDIDHEDIHLRSWCNFVIESYGSDTTVAFSEKIFRALVLPVPWTLYGGHHAVAYLESLGFDCMSDMINHNHYDRLKEIEDKTRIYIWFSLRWVREAQQMDQDRLRLRCQTAAEHNRALLSSYQTRWENDFQQWLNDLPGKLSSL